VVERGGNRKKTVHNVKSVKKGIDSTTGFHIVRGFPNREGEQGTTSEL